MIPDNDAHEVDNSVRSNAYEVALIDGNRTSNDDGSYLMEDAFAGGDLKIDVPLPLQIKIDLGNGEYANILAHKNSNSRELAMDFCRTRNLTHAIIEPLSLKIKNNID